MRYLSPWVVVALQGIATAGLTAEPKPSELSDKLRGVDARVIVLGTVKGDSPLAPMLGRDVRAGLRAANLADAKAWDEVKSRADWERFRDRRLAALRTALGEFPSAPQDLKVKVTRTLEGDGYRVDNLVYESRPGLFVTANLYRPAQPAKSMPGIIVTLSHQSPKENGWRQDMGMTWARAGCLVLIPDHLGHGERRQHPYITEKDFPKAFPLNRQDYYFRYDAGVQLQLIGDSLMGWLVWDQMRGVDVLLGQPDIDPKRILLISEPAGGGDVAGVAAALDPRIAGAVVNNFGGPQPETPYPLPADTEQTFEYAGGGSWESTRNLRLSARDGFLHWQIVASLAPRRLLYYHEFYWDREHDPVWKRLQKVWSFHEAGDALAGAAGRGFVVGSSPENTHWTPESREVFYPVLERWFGIPNPKKEYSQRRPVEELLCLTPAIQKDMRPLHVLAGQLGEQRATAAREKLSRLSPEERRARLREDWTKLLGDVRPRGKVIVRESRTDSPLPGGVTVERVHLQVEPGIVVPVLLLLPPRSGSARLPVTVAVVQGDKQEFLKQRAEVVAGLLSQGVAVCLLDVRGVGESSPGGGREPRSQATTLSASGLLLGQTLLAGRLRDLRSVLDYLRQRPDLDGKRLALWGDSFAPVNPAEREFVTPHGSEGRPHQPEPLGGLLALLGGLFDDDIRAIHARGGLGSYQSVLQGPCCYLPHDAVIPGVLTIGDLPELTAALAPRPLRLEGVVDGFNRPAAGEALAAMLKPARAAFATAKADDRLQVVATGAKAESPDQWFVRQLQAK
ncbi:MAG: acetylxylan esterase [Planctomycetia bacterium]|nr:acetylxylan esterase [Planctomycetia bacterium]